MPTTAAAGNCQSFLHKFEECIKEVASAAYTDTTYQERSHKDLKPSALHTNNHTADRQGQMVRHAAHASASRHLLDAAANDDKTR